MSLATNTVKELVRTIRATVNDEPTPDLVADLKHAERLLADLRREVISEVAGEQEGRAWRIVETRKAKRSYNDDALLSAFDIGRLDWTLRRLLDEGVLRLDWRWTQLDRYAAKSDVSLNVAKHEIESGDPEHVGEVWESRLDVKPL